VKDLNPEEIEFKEELIGLDFINSRPEEDRTKIIADVRLIAIALKNPKLTYEDLIAIPINDFLEIYIQFKRKYPFNEVKVPIEKKKGFQFVKESDIKFSKVKQ